MGTGARGHAVIREVFGEARWDRKPPRLPGSQHRGPAPMTKAPLLSLAPRCMLGPIRDDLGTQRYATGVTSDAHRKAR